MGRYDANGLVFAIVAVIPAATTWANQATPGKQQETCYREYTGNTLEDRHSSDLFS